MAVDKIDRWIHRHASIVQVTAVGSWTLIALASVILAIWPGKPLLLLCPVIWTVPAWVAWWWAYQEEDQQERERRSGGNTF